MRVKDYYMDLLQKGKIEKVLDFADENFGEWKVVTQKDKDGKIRCHTSFPTDISNNTELEEYQVLTEVKKHTILITGN